MPSIAALTINDGAATPVAHTFTPGGSQGLKTWFYDKVTGIASGFSKLIHEVREAKDKTQANSVLINIEYPILGTVNGVTSVVRKSSFSGRFNHAQDSTDQERKDLVAYAINTLSNATVKPSLYNIEPFFG